MNFWDNEREAIVDKCPQCNEEFVSWKGGAQCSHSCSEKQLEEEHKQVVNSMINLALPKISTQVHCPKYLPADYIRLKGWGWTSDVGKKITIPWYTLRSKKEFFDTVAHESGHILAYEEKFIQEEKKIINTYYNMYQEYEKSPLLVRSSQLGERYSAQLKNYYQKHKKIIDKYTDKQWRSRKLLERPEPRWAHGRDYFYLAYKKCFSRLINSPRAQYNYSNSTQPRSFEEVKFYGKTKKDY